MVHSTNEGRQEESDAERREAERIQAEMAKVSDHPTAGLTQTELTIRIGEEAALNDVRGEKPISHTEGRIRVFEREARRRFIEVSPPQKVPATLDKAVWEPLFLPEDDE